MTKVSIIGKGIKSLNVIKTKLEDRDASVVCLNNLDELKDVQSNVLILTKNENDKVLQKYSKNWESERLAKMDSLLMNLAVTEAKEFSSIPLKVTLNEYIEISKFYSTPKSNGFINGVLDKIFADLKKDGKLTKVGRGLIN